MGILIQANKTSRAQSQFNSVPHRTPHCIHPGLGDTTIRVLSCPAIPGRLCRPGDPATSCRSCSPEQPKNPARSYSTGTEYTDLCRRTRKPDHVSNMGPHVWSAPTRGQIGASWLLLLSRSGPGGPNARSFGINRCCSLPKSLLGLFYAIACRVVRIYPQRTRRKEHLPKASSQPSGRFPPMGWNAARTMPALVYPKQHTRNGRRLGSNPLQAMPPQPRRTTNTSGSPWPQTPGHKPPLPTTPASHRVPAL